MREKIELPEQEDGVLALPGLGPVAGTQFAGYAGQNDASLFYWFAGPKDYAQRPTILWTNGGPGASSFWGFFLGNGPYEIDASGTLTPRPMAWNETAGYMIFDQPLSVGLSFAGDGAQVPKNVHEGTSQLYQALVHFMAKHPEIRRQPLILAGESYGGTYVPLLAKAILDGNAGKPESERIQLGGAILVSGWVAPSIQQGMDSTYALIHGLITPEDKEALDKVCNECQAAIAAETPSSKHAYDVCGKIKSTIEKISGRYLYNLAQTGDPDTAPVTAYLSRADVRAAIHARPEGEFTFFSERIGSRSPTAAGSGVSSFWSRAWAASRWRGRTATCWKTGPRSMNPSHSSCAPRAPASRRTSTDTSRTPTRPTRACSPTWSARRRPSRAARSRALYSLACVLPSLTRRPTLASAAPELTGFRRLSVRPAFSKGCRMRG